jgi:hypothetical protein
MRVAAASAWAQPTGLRLCGIALDAPTPSFGAASSISPTSGCERSEDVARDLAGRGDDLGHPPEEVEPGVAMRMPRARVGEA